MDLFTMAEAIEMRDRGMASVEGAAGAIFKSRARQFILEYLEKNGPSPGENITEACVKAGIKPHDLRAFGPVYMSLAKDGLITKAGTCRRRLGHGTTGGNIWRLA